jgi:hypothetical protein
MSHPTGRPYRARTSQSALDGVPRTSAECHQRTSTTAHSQCKIAAPGAAAASASFSVKSRRSSMSLPAGPRRCRPHVDAVDVDGKILTEGAPMRRKEPSQANQAGSHCVLNAGSSSHRAAASTTRTRSRTSEDAGTRPLVTAAQNAISVSVTKTITASSMAVVLSDAYSYSRNRHPIAIRCGRSRHANSRHRSTIAATQRHASRRW